MRLVWVALVCGLSVGCTGAETPAGNQARPGTPDQGSSSHTAPAASTNPTSGEAMTPEPGADEPVGLRCKGTVLTARESPQNKKDPSKGGHWIVELEVEEWSAADESAQPAEPLRLIVPRDVVARLAQPPATGERLDVVATLVAGKSATARVETLSPVDSPR